MDAGSAGDFGVGQSKLRILSGEEQPTSKSLVVTKHYALSKHLGKRAALSKRGGSSEDGTTSWLLAPKVRCDGSRARFSASLKRSPHTYLR